MFWNDEKCCFFRNGRRFTLRTDDVVDVSISFEAVGNYHMIMTTYLPFSFVSGGVMHTAAEGDKFTLPLDRDVVLVSVSDPYRMHTMRIAKRAPPSLAPAVRTRLNMRWHRDPVRAKPRAEATKAKAEPKRRKLREFHMC